MRNPVYVTRPFLPPLEEFIQYLTKIWENRILTNAGPYHEELEQKLSDYLQVKYISLFSNGTLALISAIKALNLTGEVITTPYSFVASTHSLFWNGIKPVFCDIIKNGFTINVEKIEPLINERTSAILPVHVYGIPCDHKKIEKIANRNKLKIIYDAAHAFGVKKNNMSVCNWGDLSVLSFHATKVFHTLEGGAVVCHSKEMKTYIDDLKNFGIRDETTITEPGINAKMNEIQAALGLLQLKYIDSIIIHRRKLTEYYQKKIAKIPGILFYKVGKDVKYNYSYFPVLIDGKKFGMSRDELYNKLKEAGIHPRRYFYPLISHFSPYSSLTSAKPENLKVAEEVARNVLCLPLYPELDFKTVDRVIEVLK